MPSSDSEDFESADEGHSNVDKKERKKRLSSSNYSDSALESDQGFIKTPTKVTSAEKASVKKETDGWDDFEVDENETIHTTDLCTAKEVGTKESAKPSTKTVDKDNKKCQDTGWDDFADWEDDGNDQFGAQQDQVPKQTSQKPIQSQPEVKSSPEQVPVASTQAGWGWGWSVDSLLSTASAGISNITSQVSQGISTVLESGIGAPDPEELARQANKAAKDTEPKASTPVEAVEKKPETVSSEEVKASGGDAFQLGSLLSGVTKFVETTGTKVIAGGLDTLETIGKKTMEVLQDGDPGLAKKRAMLGLDSGDKPILSQVLREAKDKADEEDRVKDQRREAKEIHYETLFDDFEGLVHLEALEMLSRQVTMRIDEKIRTVDPEKRLDIKETLQQVAELCEMPEEDDDDDDDATQGDRADGFHERLQTATQDLGLKLQFQPLVGQYTETLDWLSNATELTDKAIYKRCVSALAQTTALSVQAYHKAGELLLTKSRRSTADEADALTQMTVVLTKHISELATLFTEKLNKIPSENKEQINNYITNIFLEAGNSSTYIQNAFQLAIPILQIGAV